MIAIIAYRQWRTANDKLRLDLFEKRFAIWKTLEQYYQHIWAEGSLTREVVLKFRHDVIDAKFLFEKDVNDHLSELINKGLSLSKTTRKINDPRDRECEDLSELVERDEELYNWFIRQSETTSPTLFKKYLGFGTTH